MAISRQILLALIGTLLSLGLLMVYSASMTARPSSADEYFFTKQAVFLVLGLILGGVAAGLPTHFYRQHAVVIFVAGLILLLLVLVPGIGSQVNGSRRWLRLPGISLQPSEFMKPIVALYLAVGIEHYWSQRDHFVRGTLTLLVPVGIAIGLIIVEPDLGASVFLVLSTLLALFVRGWPIGRLLVIGLTVAPVASVWLILKPYQLRRLQGFLATWTDFDQAPYQVQQSLTTLGVGGLTGTGLGGGTQKLSFLPEANTDFVFSVVGEELGMVGTLGVAAMWIAVLWTGYRVLQPLRRDSWQFTLGFVLICQLVAQAAVNVAVTTAMVPPKGIAHPLLSYGGSSLCASLLSIGMLMSISRSQETLPPSDASRSHLHGIGRFSG